MSGTQALGLDEPDLAAGYAAAREACAMAVLERGVLAVGGPQRQKFLHDILSNDLLGRKPGEGCLAALMTPRGHIVAFARALVTTDAILLETDTDRLKPLEDALVHYRVGAPVRFQVEPAAVLALLGPDARHALAKAGCEVPDLRAECHAAGRLAGHDVLVARASDVPAAGFVVHVAGEVARAAQDALLAAGARPVGRQALDALRVEDGRPWYGADVGEENLLHETGLLGEYHSPTKGCYIGQEVVARLEARGGNVNKALRGLRLSAPAERGAPVTAGGKEVGRVTTAAVSPRLGPIAMAYVHRNHFAPGTTLAVGGAQAKVVALPFDR